MRYTIIVNQPGYLPETEPYEVDDFDAAMEALAEELSQTLGHEYGTANSDPAIQRFEGGDDVDVLYAYAGEYVHEARPIHEAGQ